MFSLLKKCHQFNLSLDIQLERFETNCAFSPFVLVWSEAYGNMAVISKLQLRFLKLIWGVKVTMPTCVVHDEVGPDRNWSKMQDVGIWVLFVTTSNTESLKICNLMLQWCWELYYACEYKLPWVTELHSLLGSSGLSYIGSDQVHSVETFKRIVRQRLRISLHKNGRVE